MLHYRHSYHAGNFADVFKHVVLVELLRVLRRKPAPFCVLDTHAGLGRYDLTSAEAQKNREFADGLLRVMACPDPPDTVAQYLALVHAENDGAEVPSCYPGSPRLIRALLRSGDRLLLSELQQTEHARLRVLFTGDAQVAVYFRDAYQGLKALLPPQERRGLVVIDPPYVRQDEYARVVTALTMAYARWPTGIYAIWYPIRSRLLTAHFHGAVMATGIRRILCAELRVAPDTARGDFVGSGLLIINPPWPLQDHLVPPLDWLRRCLEHDRQGGKRLDWLVPE